MKNKMKIIGVMIVVAIAALGYLQINRSESLDNLLLENIEALAAGESSSSVRCIGDGSVVCPINKVGVAHVRITYSLPN